MPAAPLGYQRRNSMRYPGYDYTQAGAYFVTFCVLRGRMLFGAIHDHEMSLNPLGQIAAACWVEFAKRHPEVLVDAYVIMPNHVHVLLWILIDSGKVRAGAPVKARRFGEAIAGSVSTLIGAYKGAVTQNAANQGLMPQDKLWQRGFWDNIVRGEQDLHGIRDYISTNPARWIDDQLHPDALPNRYNRAWQR